MKMLTNISAGMKRFANRKYIIPLLVMLIIILVFMEQGPFGSGKLKEMSGGVGMLDMKFGYSTAQVYSLLDKVGITGRLLYSKLLGLDFLFAMVYMALQSLLITALTRKVKLNARWEKLNLLPIIRSMLDIVENCLLLFIIAGFPVQHTVAVSIASAATIVKLSINNGYIAIVFVLGALTTRQAYLSQFTKHKLNETRQAI